MPAPSCSSNWTELDAGLSIREDQIRELCHNNGCTEIRVARDEKERAALWAGRKGAFGACGRLSPNMYLTDTVVPRNRLPEILAQCLCDCAQTSESRSPMCFMRATEISIPSFSTMRRISERDGRMLAACSEITEACVAVGGCLSGEHGIGLDKRDSMDRQFSEPDLEAMLKLKRAFDPEGSCNPEKVLPQRLACGEAGRWDPKRLPEASGCDVPIARKTLCLIPCSTTQDCSVTARSRYGDVATSMSATRRLIASKCFRSSSAKCSKIFFPRFP